MLVRPRSRFAARYPSTSLVMPRPQTQLEALAPGQLAKRRGISADGTHRLIEGEQNQSKEPGKLVPDRRTAGLTPNELARYWRVSNHTIRAWIKSGELRAINLALTALHRPRYLVRWEDIETFESLRTNRPITSSATNSATVRPDTADPSRDRY